MTDHPRMSATDYMMFIGDEHPMNRSVMTNIEILDRSPDWRRLQETFDRLSRVVPRFRQRVILPSVPTTEPRWVVDPDFDLSYHLRRTRLQEPGTMRQLLDTVEVFATEDGLVSEANFRAWNAPPEVGASPGLNSTIVKLAAISRNEPIDEKTQRALKRLPEDRVKRSIEAAIRRNVLATGDALERTRGSLIAEGKVTNAWQKNFKLNEDFGRDPASLDRARDEVFAVVQIESRGALEDADAIAANVVRRVKGSDLVGLTYTPPFTYFVDDERVEGKAWRILAADYVTTDDGTGLVHMAPAFGEEDKAATDAAGIPAVVPVGPDGRFTYPVSDYQGMQVFEQVQIPVRQQGDAYPLAGPVLLEVQFGDDPVAHRPGDQVQRVLPVQLGQTFCDDLDVADLAQYRGQFLQVGEHGR